jgi:hypothetical protein
MWLTDREKQIRAWANMSGNLDEYSLEDLVVKIEDQVEALRRKEVSDEENLGHLLALLIIYANKKGLTLEDCLCYTVQEIQQGNLNSLK